MTWLIFFIAAVICLFAAAALLLRPGKEVDIDGKIVEIPKENRRKAG